MSPFGVKRFRGNPGTRFLIPAGLLVCGLAGMAGAQQTTAPANAAPATQAPAADPVLKLSPMAQMKALEPPADEEYTLGPADEISVEVPGHPELSGKRLIGPDGRITLPTAGTVNLAGLTREQASDAVTKAYAQYYRDPVASIGIEKYGSNRVLVIGSVQHQGYVTFEQTPTLLEAITQAGLIQPTGAQGGVQTIQSTAIKTQSQSAALPQECKIYRGTGENQQVVSVNLHQLFTSGNGMSDLRLRRNDIVFVPNPHDRFVSVLGEVGHPGPVQLTDDVNLPALISEAGGITDKAGNNPSIAIVDPSTQRTRYIKYKDLITPNGMNEVALQPGDLIVVPKSGLTKVGYVFQQLSPITGIASILAITAF